MARLRVLAAPALKSLRMHPGFKEAILLHDWNAIVGSDLSSRFAPIKITKVGEQRFLQVCTSSAGMVTAKYLEPMLLEKINRFFGSSYVSAIRTRQGVVPQSNASRKTIKELPEPTNLEEALKALELRVLNAG
jgi:hypothetical protein